MGSRQGVKSPKIWNSRPDANSEKKHVMKVHDGMILKGYYQRVNSFRRKGIN